ncbi:MAG: hypothetical protein J6B08_00915 [Ruminiclostridium sp.]|nr:hypothetical protein [Ruminiclostridium sp.]
MKIRKILAAAAGAAVAVSALATTAAAADYTGYIGFQTTTYSFRNDWDEANYGLATDYFDDFVVWGDANTDPETFPEYEDYFDYDIAGYLLPATYTDVAITGDGTYTVKAEGIDWGLKSESDFNLIFVSTNIPIDAGAVCTSATVYVDGEAVKTYENPICDETKACFNIGLVNIWNTDIGSYGLAFPTESLAIEFTVEGLGAPAADEAPVADEAPAAGDVDASTDSSKGSPDTGVEDVAVIGGLAILAGAAIAFTRKRK